MQISSRFTRRSLAVAFALPLVAACAEPEPPYEEGLPNAPYTSPDAERLEPETAHARPDLDRNPPANEAQGEEPSPSEVPPPNEELPGEEEPPADEQPPAEEEPPVAEPSAEEEPPVEEEPSAEEEAPAEEEPPVEETGPTHLPPPSDCPSVRVSNDGGVGVNVRPSPSTAEGPVGALASNAVVTVLSVVPDGQEINGDTTWYEIMGDGVTGYIAGYFAVCTDPSAQPTFPASTFLLPLQCGKTATVTQGNNTSFSHSGFAAYAFDFGLTANTPLVAMKRGTVIFRDASTQPGDPCYSGGGSECINEANLVVLQHNDGTDTSYAHVNSIPVSVGQVVERGQIVAYSGGTGWSTGPHAHVARQNHCGWSGCQSVPMSFGDVSGDGVPVGGEVVTSQNCP